MILKKLFGFDPSVMKVKTEVMAGITTFFNDVVYSCCESGYSFGGIDGSGGCVHGHGFGGIYCHAADGYFGKITFRFGSGYGIERFFCFHVGAGYGVFLGECLGGCICRGDSVYPVDRV